MGKDVSSLGLHFWKRPRRNHWALGASKIPFGYTPKHRPLQPGQASGGHHHQVARGGGYVEDRLDRALGLDDVVESTF